MAAESDTTWAYSPTAASSTPVWKGSRQQLRHSGRFSADELAWQAWQNNDAYPPHAQVHDTHPRVSSFSPPPDPTDSPTPSRTLCMGNLEPWMDHEYVGQVVQLMGWDRTPSSQSASSITAPVTIKIPPPPQDISPQPNNPGYCLLTFSSLSQAASVLASVPSASSGDHANPKDGNATPNGGSASGLMLMPNSSRFFHLHWATTTQVSLANAMISNNVAALSSERSLSVSSNAAATGADNLRPSSSLSYPLISGTHNGQGLAHAPAHVSHHEQGQQKEHSIFVGDLAPETSNSDLVAVFRNPVLGLRNDRYFI